MKEYVLDSNALVRLFRNAPGAETVDELVRQAKTGRARLSISVVNLIEVVYVLTRFFGREKALECVDKARDVAESFPVDEQTALNSGCAHSLQIGPWGLLCCGTSNAPGRDVGYGRPGVCEAGKTIEGPGPASTFRVIGWHGCERHADGIHFTSNRIT